MDRKLQVIMAQKDPLAAAPTLLMKKAVGRELLARASEIARQQFMTSGDIKSAVYREKQAEALAFQAVVDSAGTPVPSDYPFLKSRAERLDAVDPDYQAVADEWNARASAWKPIGAQIEGLYEAAVEAVDAATTQEEVQAALQVAWPMPS